MPHYRATDNSLHFIESDEFAHLLPAGVVQITDAEAEALRHALVVSVPSIVTMRQARLALLQTGMLASVNAAVVAADEATQIAWEFSGEVQRRNPLVSTLSIALGLTDAQLDDLFTLAATL